jgi:hypothetical protein
MNSGAPDDPGRRSAFHSGGMIGFPYHGPKLTLNTRRWTGAADFGEKPAAD